MKSSSKRPGAVTAACSRAGTARGGGSGSPSIDRHHARDARVDAAEEVTRLEARDDVVLDDAFGARVRQRAFETVADFDPQRAVFHRDHAAARRRRRPCGRPSTASAARMRIARSPPAASSGTISTAIWLPLRASNAASRLFERGPLLLRERAGEIGDARGKRRHRRLRDRKADEQQHCGGSDPPQKKLQHRLLAGAGAGALAGGASGRGEVVRSREGDGGAPKSTVGGRAISLSFSTVNCGFSLWPNTIAVRLVGNERTVTLNSCTALM